MSCAGLRRLGLALVVHLVQTFHPTTFRPTLIPQTMTVLIPRTRAISVRLSEGEFSALEKLCATTGARSISDLARNAMTGLLDRANQESALLSNINEHSAQMKDLKQQIEILAAEIASLKADTQSDRIDGTGNSNQARDIHEPPEDQSLD